MGNAKVDENSRPALTAVSNIDKTTIVPLYADPTSHRLLVSTVAGGLDTQVQYNKNGVIVGDTELVWDYTNVRLGIGTTPQAELDVNGAIKTLGYTVATLPTGIVGMRAYVTDATTPTYLGALTGGGAVVCSVFYDGTQWVSA